MRSFLRSYRLPRPTLILVAIVALGLCTAGCADSHRDYAPGLTSDDFADFAVDLTAMRDKGASFLDETRAGQNVSTMRMGWYAIGLLQTLAAMDTALAKHFYAASADMQIYLETQFQYHPAEELKALDTMAQDGHPALRMSARNTLAALRDLPIVGDPPEKQKIERLELADSLTRLLATLDQSIKEAEAAAHAFNP